MICKFSTCTRLVKAKGLCDGHYQQLLRGSELRPLRQVVRAVQTCSVDGCGNRSKVYADKDPMCPKHYFRWKNHGDPNRLVRDAIRPTALAAIQDAVANRDRSECWTDWATLPCWEQFKGTRYGGTVTRGYPTVGMDKVMWLVMKADGRPRPPAPGNHGLHGCDNTLCWNPGHLRWGTHFQNVEDLHSSRNYCKHCPHCNP